MVNILVVDDDPAFLDTLEQMLSTAGYRAIRARNGKEAVDELDQRHAEIRLAIVDLALPDINGFELLGAITRRVSHVKVLVMTSVYKDIHLEMAGSLGADAAIRKPPEGKPLPEHEWLSTIRQLLGAEERGPSAPVTGESSIPGIPNGQ